MGYRRSDRLRGGDCLGGRPLRQGSGEHAGLLPRRSQEGYTREQVIDDILDQYERHLQFLHLNRMEPGSINMPDSPEQPPG
ncbi:hypothetical protein R3F72_17685 [Salinicola sp. 4072]|uniref:hypothetical protein n=1 Tax=Salinicola sp. 4072 TaxID=3082157 RepID=UPI002FCA8978